MRFETEPGRLAVVHSLERAAESFGERLAVRQDGVERTWRETHDRVSRVAYGLRRLGVGTSTRVAVAMTNRPEYLELFFAVAWAGGIVVPLNTRMASAELRAYLTHVQPQVIICDAHGAGALSDVDLSGVTRIAVGADPPIGEQCYEDLATGPQSSHPTERTEKAVAALFSTGGTTGRPRAVMLTERNLTSNAYHTAIALGYGADEIYLHAAPMFHIADCSSLFAVTLAGGAHTFLSRFAAADFLQAVERERVTATLLVPTMVAAAVDHPALAAADLSTWRTLFYGGAPMPMSVLQRATERLPCRFIQGYGMTEVSLGTILDVADHARGLEDPAVAKVLRSCGRPAPGVRVRIVDQEGNILPAGDIGELQIAGPNVSSGYWSDPQATAMSRTGGWLRTGDLGHRDESGLIYLADRAKDVIITGGENVYSIEVENILHLHPQVAEAAVVGVSDEYWGERVHAFVVKRDSETTADELDRHVREHLAGYKAPRTYEFVPDLPKTGAGKIKKSVLRGSGAGGEVR